MDLTKIFEKQIKLDEAIDRAHGLSNTNSIVSPSVDRAIIQKRVLAVIVELSEFANEISSFKYWKKNVVIDREKMLEEYADGIHFLTTMSYKAGVGSDFTPKVISDDINKQFIFTFQVFSNLALEYTNENIIEAYSSYLGFVKLLDITDDELFESYNKKNKINYERIKNNY